MNNHNRSRSPIDGKIVGSQQKRPVSEGHLRVGPLVEVPQILRELGVDPAEIVRGVGLDSPLFDDPEHLISFTAVGRLLKECAARTQCPYFGLLIGQRSGPGCLGVLGALAQNRADVGSALRGLILHLHVHDRGAAPALSVERGVVVLSYLIYQPGIEGSSQIYDGSIAITFNIPRALCGPAWRPAEVWFSHRRPSDSEPYRRFFQVALRFDMEQTALGVSGEMARPCRGRRRSRPAPAARTAGG
jgi:hypothetical protein